MLPLVRGAFRNSFLEQVGTPIWSEVCAKTKKITTFNNMGQHL